MGEVTRNWENYTYSYYEDGQTKEDEIGGTCRSHAGYEKCIQILAEKPDGKISIVIARNRWEDKTNE
jgi:hypothetical protein